MRAGSQLAVEEAVLDVLVQVVQLDGEAVDGDHVGPFHRNHPSGHRDYFVSLPEQGLDCPFRSGGLMGGHVRLQRMGIVALVNVRTHFRTDMGVIGHLYLCPSALIDERDSWPRELREIFSIWENIDGSIFITSTR